ncbi:MAG: hypothetical protein ABIG10_00415 [bacterium]
MYKLTKRQQEILSIIQKNKQASNKIIKEKIEEIFGQITRMTIVRDLELLLKNNLITKYGSGRNIYYRLNPGSSLLEYFDIEKYFKIDFNKRNIKNKFNFDIFKEINDSIISKNEIIELEKLNKDYKKRFKLIFQGMNSIIFKNLANHFISIFLTHASMNSKQVF